VEFLFQFSIHAPEVKAMYCTHNEIVAYKSHKSQEMYPRGKRRVNVNMLAKKRMRSKDKVSRQFLGAR
jgi:hypothetical protein